MILHSLPLAVESIVLGPREGRALGARESTLEGSADSWGAQLRRKALGGSDHRSLREHGVVVVVQSAFWGVKVCLSDALRSYGFLASKLEIS